MVSHFVLFLTFLPHQPSKFDLLFLGSHPILPYFLFLKRFLWSLSWATSNLNKTKLIVFLFFVQEILLPTSSILLENKISWHPSKSCQFGVLNFLNSLFLLCIRYINFLFASVLAFAYQGNLFFFALNSSLNSPVSLSMIYSIFDSSTFLLNLSGSQHLMTLWIKTYIERLFLSELTRSFSCHNTCP